MTTIRMTKRFVADILRKEPLSGLTFGEFVAGNAHIKASDEGCASCAVGTVVRRVLADGATAAQARDVAFCMQCSQPGSGWTCVVVCDDDGPWRALSKTYESAVRLSSNPNRSAKLADGRRAAVRYVEKHFPSHVTLDINGYKARKARGVTVVKRKAKR